MVLAMLLAATGQAYGQNDGQWRFRELTSFKFNKYSPQVQIDRWGHRHVVWGSQNPYRAGLQLFYSNDATGIFTSPLLATDIGTVVDSANASFVSHVFRVDARGQAHIAFIANVTNQLQLYYTTNPVDEFTTPIVVGPRNAFDMAVDSLGRAFIVWIEENQGKPRLRYWNSTTPVSSALTIDLPVVSGVRLGYPEIEIGSRGARVAVRCDSSVVFFVQQPDPAAPFSQVQRLTLPPYDSTLVRNGRADLRIRMAMDNSGSVHILAPHYDTSRQIRHQLVYLSNSTGSFSWRYLTADTLDSAALDFDIASNDVDRLSVTWTTDKYRQVIVKRPSVSFLELAPDSDKSWMTLRFQSNLNILFDKEFDYRKTGMQLAARGDRVAIAGIRYVHSDSAEQQLGLYERTSLEPRIRYLHPDAAGPGMNVVVESYAHVRDNGSFGPDGLRPDSVGLEFVNPGDAVRVIIGPTVISWDGRLASTMLFVRSDAPAGPVPLRLHVGSAVSNVDTFFIQNPQRLGNAGSLNGGGVLGAGGIYGRRSKRGVLVVDSLVLGKGMYRIDTTDTDPVTPGNQGFLPVTILSRGPVRIDSGATLDVSGRHDTQLFVYGTAGPGGGGGGSGGQVGGGSGYAAGGGPGAYIGDQSTMGASVGSGGLLNGRWIGGAALSGISGGATFPVAAAGGGTGHPFGASGSFGKVSPNTPLVTNGGAYGAGSGGPKASATDPTSYGGGGGAHQNLGGSGGTTGEGSNGGLIVGNVQIVPLAGGSGGGGGGYSSSGFANGGGGGGALSILGYKDIVVRGTLLASGANGVNALEVTNASGGGGGAGGGIILGAKGNISVTGLGVVVASGGTGGTGKQGGRNGGNGAPGRIRIDGHASGSLSQVVPFPRYSGATTISSTLVSAQPGAVLMGYGMPGRTVRVFTRAETGNWSYATPRDILVRVDSTWRLTLGPEAAGGKLYIAVLQRTDNPSDIEFSSEPAWVMSAAGSNVLGRPSVALSVSDLSFPCIRFDSCVTLNLPINNPGQITDLMISNIRIVGADSAKFTSNVKQFSVAAGTTGMLSITFCPRGTGSFSATLLLPTNAVGSDSLKSVTITGCAITGHLTPQPATELDLGDMCIGSCRDTSILLRNDGEAPLVIQSVRSAANNLSVQVLDPPVPFTIVPGDTVRLRIRLCVTRFDGADFRMVIRTTTIDSITTLIIRARNIGPDPEVPAEIDFGEVTVDTGDSCMERRVTIRNRHASAPLRLRTIISTTTNFTVVDAPAADTLIAPGDSVSVLVRFCASDTGDAFGSLSMDMGEGDCALRSTVRLTGRGVASGPHFVILQPQSHTIIFPSTLLGDISPYDTIVVRNIGGTKGILNLPIKVIYEGADAEIEVDFNGVSYPVEIAPKAEVLLLVRLKPVTKGNISGALIFDGEGWRDTVLLFGRGVKPGIQVNAPRLNFGNVRVGTESAEQELLVYNLGNAPVNFSAAEIPVGTEFAVTSTSPSLPRDIMPAVTDKDTVRLKVVFKPTVEGVAGDTLRVVNASTEQPEVYLGGNGVLEHVAIDRSQIDFDCIEGESKDSVNAFTVRNTGTYPLVISEMPTFPLSSNFSVIGTVFPDTIKPGASRSYTVRYTPGSKPVSARLNIVNSAPEAVSIDLLGDVCFEDGEARISMTDTLKSVVGSSVVLPIMVDFTPLPEAPISYELTFSYDWDLLAPVTQPGTTVGTPVTAGTISTTATMAESTPGVLQVIGTIDPARTGRLLIGIPMKVLLGHDYLSPLAISDVRFEPEMYRITVSGATFQALDCDTNGGVIIGAGKYALKQNVPNPAVNATVIHYEIGRHQRVRLNVYNSMGTFITALVDEVQSAGVYDYQLDTRSLGSGIYTYELVAGPFRKTYRLVITE
jgi:hypothetical protein